MTMDDSHEKILGMGIDELELSVRSYNCLKRAGINTVEELCKMSSEDMMAKSRKHIQNSIIREEIDVISFVRYEGELLRRIILSLSLLNVIIQNHVWEHV